MTHSPYNAPGQTWRASSYAHHAGFVPALGRDVATLLAPRPGERILDLGCGDGTLTTELAKSGATLVGVDASTDMVDAARTRGLDARVADAHHLPFDHEFDAVFSNAALHWMFNHEAVVASIHRALKPGGRFVAEFGGHGNVAAICTAMLAALRARGISGKARFPWFFPTVEEYRECLESAGFTVASIQLIPRPTPLPTGMGGWLATFANPFLHGLSDDIREVILDDAIGLLAPSLCDSHGNWTADYVRLRVKAHT
ncbi:class I SAM-dependent methyltransferase [Billgrantia endophytica]|uniref:SAM-dependent methyltransferase n=1 Tax=Billgrantia endophytica TaxID=2033802 RepID=A0A2N7U4L1_9GAMM|nr:class I SAM-dependent methyltransferase [Halomonas endophytica]PMR75364.1 SAM-dependent methyltransferase [Halomonas endophytica]